MDYPKSLPDVYLHEGKFTDGTPDGAVEPSRDPAKTQNDIIDSILFVQNWTGEAPNEADITQMGRGIDARIDEKIATIDIPEVDLSGVAMLGVAQVFTKAQLGAILALADAATITPDFTLANNFALTIGGNRTLANPSNLAGGQYGVVVITQDATGSRTLAYGSYWKFIGGSTPSLTPTAGAVDVLVWYAESATRITARMLNDLK